MIERICVDRPCQKTTGAESAVGASNTHERDVKEVKFNSIKNERPEQTSLLKPLAFTKPLDFPHKRAKAIEPSVLGS